MAFLIIAPLLLVVLGSFKTRGDAAHFTLTLPAPWDFSSYETVVSRSPIFRSFFNSLFLTSISTFLVLMISAPAAFVIARRNNRAMKGLFSVFMLGIIAPISIIPTVVVIRALGLYGSYWGGIALYTARFIPWSLFLMTGFVKTIPRELDEAAILDGCSPYKMFLMIITPLLRSIMLTCMVFIAMNVWNDFQIPIYFFSSSEKWTMPLLVYNFFGQYMRIWNNVFASLILTALPITILYMFVQQYIIAGMTQGSVKG
ncbi:MAG: carbohydrate ABC transporter permease [Spirochaetales bacterium]|nr:carbohydrate ABC transporter permease [Spirochaetales bacterium]